MSATQKQNYKDALFVSIFGRHVNSKEYFLSLYNAIHDTNFKIGEVTITPVMLENVIYRGVRNDVSMQINDSIIVLAEHQSTVNNNMPFRCLEYLVAHYNKFFTNNDKYNTELIKLPRPECYVFYNGDKEFPQEAELKLSDAFSEINKKCQNPLPESLMLDLTVKVYNINKSANHPILQKCEALLAYSNFTEYARIGKERGMKNPVQFALKKCRQGKFLADYFKNLSKEEQSMIFGEWDEDMFVKVQSEIAVKHAARESAKNLLIETDLSPEKISKCCSLPLDDVLTIKEELETETVIK